MKESLAQRHHRAIFLVLVAGGLGLTTVGVKAPERVMPLERVGMSVAAPFASSGSSLATFVSDLTGGIGSVSAAHAELEMARREIRDLQGRLDAQRESNVELRRLQELLGLQATAPGTALAARVVAQEVAPDRTLTINRGQRHGLRKDLAVLAPDGAVGKILSVTDGFAKVQCLTDPDAGLAVLVGEGRHSVKAIVADAEDGLLRLRHAADEAQFAVGQLVVTSGLEMIYPKGLSVGVVESVSPEEELERVIQVTPSVDFSTLEEVLVLIPAPTPGLGGEGS